MSPLLYQKDKSLSHEPSVSKYVNGWGEQNSDIGLIAEKDEQAIGAIWLRLFEEEDKSYVDGETPEIGIAVLKEFRGEGVGSALIRALETKAIKYGYQKLCLSVDPRNSACRLYEQFGYVHIDWDDPYWLMEKRLFDIKQ